MLREKIVSSSSIEQIELGSAASLIAAAKVPFSDETRSAVLEVLEAECGQVARSVAETKYSELHLAESAAAHLKKRLEAAEAALAEAEERLRRLPESGSWVKVFIWSLCSLACFSAEFVLTWTSLCFVLDVPKVSVLGVLLGLAPPCGLAVLEVFLARIFEEPWQRLRKAPLSGRRFWSNVSMAALLLSLALGNGLTIVHLAKAREEAIKIQRNVQSQEDDPATPVKFDQAAIDRAVLWISLCVCVDGSLFLLLALAQGACLRERRRTEVSLAVTQGKRETLETDFAAAEARVKNSAEAWETAAQAAALAADRYRAHCHYLIAEKNQAWFDVSIEERVDRAVRRRFSA